MEIHYITLEDQVFLHADFIMCSREFLGTCMKYMGIPNISNVHFPKPIIIRISIMPYPEDCAQFLFRT